jgi:sn-glycerol 3-phosphate transport system ATP-binding protein
MGEIKISNLTKKYDKSTSIIENLNLLIPDGSFTVILGPSGCGKSTLLRMISGLEEVSDGKIFINEMDITEKEPKDRNVAMVFQDYALYPHMTAYQNIEYGLKIKKVPKDKRKEMVNRALQMVELQDQSKKLPMQMSGGQRQRVALARAIVKKPEVFLMDEPLSNLDAKLRITMRETISGLHKQLNTTFVFVTHDQVEAMSMGDHIVILNKGKVMQQGSPKEIYTDPKNTYVASFIGSPATNILEWEHGFIGIRPENVSFEKIENESIEMETNVRSIEQLGGNSIYILESEYGEIKVNSNLLWQNDTKKTVHFPLDKIMYFDRNGNRIYETTGLEEKLKVYFKNKIQILI